MRLHMLPEKKENVVFVFVKIKVHCHNRVQYYRRCAKKCQTEGRNFAHTHVNKCIVCSLCMKSNKLHTFSSIFLACNFFPICFAYIRCVWRFFFFSFLICWKCRVHTGCAYVIAGASSGVQVQWECMCINICNVCIIWAVLSNSPIQENVFIECVCCIQKIGNSIAECLWCWSVFFFVCIQMRKSSTLFFFRFATASCYYTNTF